jgi:hypothetical protein
MHFLRKMRGGDEEHLPELRRGISAPAPAEVKTIEYAVNISVNRRLKTMVRTVHGRGESAGAF